MLTLLIDSKLPKGLQLLQIDDVFNQIKSNNIDADSYEEMGYVKFADLELTTADVNVVVKFSKLVNNAKFHDIISIPYLEVLTFVAFR